MSDSCGTTVPSCEELSIALSTVEHFVVVLAVGATIVGVIATALYPALRWVRCRRQISRTIAEVESALAAAARRRLRPDR